MYKCRDEAGNVERRRRKKKKEGHETDQECALCSHTIIIITTNHTRVLFEADFFFLLLSLLHSLSYILTDVEFTHRIFLCLFSEHLNIIFDLFDDIISFLEN